MTFVAPPRWIEAANRWCDRLDVTGFPGACRVHRAELMRMRGDLAAAEKVAIAACDELLDFERYITAGGYYEIVADPPPARGPRLPPRRPTHERTSWEPTRSPALPCSASQREARCRGRGNHPRAPGGARPRSSGFDGYRPRSRSPSRLAT